MPNVVHFSHVTLNFFGKPLSPWEAGIYDRATQSLALWARMLYIHQTGSVTRLPTISMAFQC